MSSTELENFVSPNAVEHMFRRSMTIKNNRSQHVSLLQQGFRAAKGRNPKLLAVLEQAAEVLHNASEAQNGESRRMAEGAALRVPHTEFTVWREAYKLADQGAPITVFQHVYAAAAEFAGVAV